ncbi:MAG: hypothetical protein ACI4FZ_07620 [Lachnospiraceae bacterium]
MNKWKFKKLMETLQYRVEHEGKKDPAWVLGFVEGLGKRKLTGYQAGAIINLLLLGTLPFDVSGNNGGSLIINAGGKVLKGKEVESDEPVSNVVSV